MPIQILSPQLANQIAAGEVVERPASVVKELVENSLDAGATELFIDIEKGGCKKILVRDNGSGIGKEELELALCRHATSKISTLDDLEQIVSLGFRGEALASISSVSRLTLTSKPLQQDTAWQANAEGREMQVQIKPAAHPVGTSIEVLDLFFNTPARRKFLRSDKTEFSHIDELIKRLALSRFDVAWTLLHNGQSVRQLRKAVDAEQQQKRVAALCGKVFSSQAARIDVDYDGMKLHGWVVEPSACSEQAVQYSYVNGRMMRDKLLNHAIRQAYGQLLLAEKLPSFVLYLEVDPRQVDVNVHPAKHEVRFHQARLVHDFVVSALQNALSQLTPAAQDTLPFESFTNNQGAKGLDGSRYESSVPNAHALPTQTDARVVSSSRAHYAVRPSAYASPAFKAPAAARFGTERSWGDSSAIAAQTQSSWHGASRSFESRASLPANTNALAGETETFNTLQLIENRYQVCVFDEQLFLQDIAPVLSRLWRETPVSALPLLLPVRLTLDENEQVRLLDKAELLAGLGFDLLVANAQVIVRGVPAWLRQTALAKWLPLWWQASLELDSLEFVHAAVVLLLTERHLNAATLGRFFPELAKAKPNEQALAVNLQAALTQLKELV